MLSMKRLFSTTISKERVPWEKSELFENRAKYPFTINNMYFFRCIQIFMFDNLTILIL